MVSRTRTNGIRLTPEERRWLKVLSTLNEAQARWFVADKALDVGRGGVSRLSQVTGMSRTTITKAIKELRGRQALQPSVMGRIRRAPPDVIAKLNQQPQVIDGASDLFFELWGPDFGKHARTAVGHVSLPRGIAVEINGEFGRRGGRS